MSTWLGTGDRAALAARLDQAVAAIAAGAAELDREPRFPAEAFRAFSESVFRDGALPSKTKQLIAVAVAHVTQCPYCIRGHTRAALRQGVTPEEIMEAIWVAAEMRAGAAFAHSALALDEIAAAHTEDPPHEK